SVAVGDFNNDTRLDLVVANSDSNDTSVLLGYGNGSFSPQITFSSGSLPWSAAVGDFNNDTRLDLVVANSGSNDVSVLLGYGNGSFEDQTKFSHGSRPRSVAVGDFNGDTLLDIVVANSGSDDVSVLVGYGNGSFIDQNTYATDLKPCSLAVGDFNNDSALDIVVANLFSNDVNILLGNINIVFVHQVTLTSGSGSRPRSLIIADFNSDSRMDIAVANSGSHNIATFLGYGNFYFANPTMLTAGLIPMCIAAGDFNNDTQLDVVVANFGSGSISIFIGYGNGSFAGQLVYSTGPDCYPYFVAAGDFNNDAIVDIVVVNQNSNDLGVFLGYGNGIFATVILVPLGYGSHPFSVLVGDYNNDRKLDLAVANGGTDSLSILLQTC
ncbi:unnamed protein product, partial [Rotaria magnacalcarata]